MPNQSGSVPWQTTSRCGPEHAKVIHTSAVSESRLSNLSPSPSHHLWVRVRVRVTTSKSESESSPQSQSPKKKFWVTNLVVHIFNICLSSKTWKQTTKCIECQSKQRNTARPLLLGLGRDSSPSHESGFLSPSPSHESRFLSLSPSQSEKNWTRVRVWVKWTRVWVPTRVTQHWSIPNPNRAPLQCVAPRSRVQSVPNGYIGSTLSTKALEHLQSEPPWNDMQWSGTAGYGTLHFQKHSHIYHKNSE